MDIPYWLARPVLVVILADTQHISEELRFRLILGAAARRRASTSRQCWILGLSGGRGSCGDACSGGLAGSGRETSRLNICHAEMAAPHHHRQRRWRGSPVAPGLGGLAILVTLIRGREKI